MGMFTGGFPWRSSTRPDGRVQVKGKGHEQGGGIASEAPAVAAAPAPAVAPSCYTGVGGLLEAFWG